MQHSPVDPGQKLEQPADDASSEGRFQLAVRLLSGPQSDANLESAIALIEAASADGFAPAIELSAVFEAMGVARPQSWDRAFDRLQRAAEQGSPGARAQLMLLADN